jgi:hypothetical protein
MYIYIIFKYDIFVKFYTLKLILDFRGFQQGTQKLVGQC